MCQVWIHPPSVLAASCSSPVTPASPIQVTEVTTTSLQAAVADTERRRSGSRGLPGCRPDVSYTTTCPLSAAVASRCFCPWNATDVSRALGWCPKHFTGCFGLLTSQIRTVAPSETASSCEVASQLSCCTVASCPSWCASTIGAAEVGSSGSSHMRTCASVPPAATRRPLGDTSRQVTLSSLSCSAGASVRSPAAQRNTPAPSKPRRLPTRLAPAHASCLITALPSKAIDFCRLWLLSKMSNSRVEAAAIATPCGPTATALLRWRPARCSSRASTEPSSAVNSLAEPSCPTVTTALPWACAPCVSACDVR
mmetsp:Transcript_12908/g.39010  ORF Transcript_12908/g.39010 Transcript_12908/m.39010 type:complete len:310 (-) Transcript_12908:232-1161(-)